MANSGHEGNNIADTKAQDPLPGERVWGTVGYCRLWIMGFAEKSHPLYERSKKTPLWTWTEPMKQAFQTLRQALLEAPALALPNPNKPFQLFVDENQGIGKGVLMQQWGPWKQPVAYFSK